MPDGVRFRDVLRLAAAGLRNDIYVTPDKAVIRAVESPSDADGRSEWEVYALDAGRRPVEWLLITPTPAEDGLPGWVATTGGRLVPRTGVAVISYANGLYVATQADVNSIDWRSARLELATLGHRDDNIATIRVRVARESGGFVVGWHGASSSRIAAVREFALIVRRQPWFGRARTIRFTVQWGTQILANPLMRDSVRTIMEELGSS